MIKPSDLIVIDEILTSGNESWTGEEIRKRLYEAGFVILPCVMRWEIAKAEGTRFPSR